MANIGSFTADKHGFSGTLRTPTLSVKVMLILNDKTSDNAHDFSMLASNGLEMDYLERVERRAFCGAPGRPAALPLLPTAG